MFPSAIGTLGSGAGTLGSCTYSCLEQVVVVWGGLYLELSVREFQLSHSLDSLVEFQSRCCCLQLFLAATRLRYLQFVLLLISNIVAPAPGSLQV